jgi:hypothetical protein
MSDPRLLLAELDATELLLRTLAIENLDYRGVLEVERIAHLACAQLLARLGGDLVAEPQAQQATRWEPSSNVPPVEDATDELLTGAASGVGSAAVVAGDGTDLIEFDGELEVIPEADAAVVGRDDPTDETPASSSEVMLRWTSEGRPALMGASDLPPANDPSLDDEDPTLADGSSIQSAVEAAETFELESRPHDEPEVEVAEDEELVELAENLEEEPLSSEYGHEAEPSWVEQPGAQPSYVSEDRWEPAPQVPAPAAPPPAGGDPWANLVTFASPEAEDPSAGDDGTAETDGAHDDPWAEQRLVEKERAHVSRPPARPAVLEPGTDALATMDNRVSRDDLLPDVEPELDELEELELESEGPPPAAGGDIDESAFEEDATLIRAAPTESARAATPAPVPPRPAPRAQGTPIGGTAGLYGSAAVPTIRDSDDPRPRAAAIQLNAAGTGGRMLGAEEEDEPIEIGEASADEIEENVGEGGFSLKVQEYEEVYEEEEEEEEEEEAPLEPDPEPEPLGPTVEELRALLGAAQAAAMSGNLQGGADLYTDLIDQDPDNVEAHVARGRLYLDLGDYSRAMSDFMVAEDLANTDPEPQVAIGDLYFARKDYRKAIEYFDQALLLQPNHAMAFCRRGISHYYRKNYPDAVTDLEKAKKIDPEIANIGTYISMARKKIGK